MANRSLASITLNTRAETLKKGLSTQNCHFQSRYKKEGGPICVSLALKSTNMFLLESEILSSFGTSNVETAATTSASSPHTSTSSTISYVATIAPEQTVVCTVSMG